MSIKVVGTLSDVSLLTNIQPSIGLKDIEVVFKTRRFIRWVSRNSTIITSLAVFAPVIAFHYLSPSELDAIIAVDKSITTSGKSFMDGHGSILIHMMIIGFLTLVVTTFLQFTGRGDLVPLIAFVGGGAILYEVIGMFRDIYGQVASFLKM